MPIILKRKDLNKLLFPKQSEHKYVYTLTGLMFSKNWNFPIPWSYQKHEVRFCVMTNIINRLISTYIFKRFLTASGSSSLTQVQFLTFFQSFKMVVI